MTTTPLDAVDRAALDEAGRLSTAPAPAASPSRGARPAPLRTAWRQLTSMRTALQLLFLLALAAVPGGFVPQRSLNPVQVRDFTAQHPALAPVLDRLWLFDVFASPWFAAIYLLLFVSLVGCLVPRIRLHAKALRGAPPAVPQALRRLPVSERWETALPPEQVLAGARRALRRGRWRTAQRETGLSAEKGHLRETGNLVFHVSLVALLVGVAVGAFTGFKGTVLVKEGDGFANTVIAYDDVTPGRRFSADRLEPFSFTLRDFRATYTEDGKALTFDADLGWSRGPGEPQQAYGLRVNEPLEIGAAKVYLIGHGYAPRVLVRDRAGHELRQTVPCLPQDGRFVSNCTIKVPNAVTPDGKADQMAFEGVLTPTTVQDPETGRVSSVHPAADDPALTVIGYRGDLGLDSGETQSVYELDTQSLTPLPGPAQGLRPGQTWELPGGGSLTFEGTTEWATFQVTQDPGKVVVLWASIALVAGLLLSLFVRRRRVWVRASAAPAGEGPAPARTVVEIGGLARTDAEAFARDFAALTARLRETAPPVDDPEPAPRDPDRTGGARG